MYIKGTKRRDEISINTPLDDPTQFSPSWRAELAVAMHTYPKLPKQRQYSEYYNDPYVKEYIKFLRSISKTDSIPNTPMGYAYKWYNNNNVVDTKYRLEPLLLTPAPLSLISQALAGDTLDEEPFKIYERLFFNIRNDDGTLNKSCHLRMHFALPTEQNLLEPDRMPITKVWRIVGAQCGYQTLCRLWMWYDAPDFNDKESKHLPEEAWWMTQSTMLTRMAKGAVSNFDLVSWIGKFTDNERLRMDESRAGDTKEDAMASAMLALLHAAAPKVLSVSRTVDEIEAINTKLAEKRQATKLAPEELSDGSDFGKVDIDDHLKQIFTQK